jgi:DNA (cytosine-5)-methyltransferase 1
MTPLDRALTGGSLCTGYGGLDIAAELLFGPIRLAWCSDTKTAAEAVLTHRYPAAANLGDLTQIDFTDVAPVDVLTAGWPCQPWSTAGRRRGEQDPRAIWPHIHRAVMQLRPRVFLGENVPRIVTSGELRRVARSLAQLGYVGAWRCFHASDVGFPHRRTRCFVLAVDPTQAPIPAIAPPIPHVAEKTRDLLLLPTPTHRDGRRGKGWGERPGRPLSETIHRIADPAGGWREYRPAIERWEYITDCPAPPPVQKNRLGEPALSARFVEWMMGVPLGHVTAVPGLTRGECISMLGDGVAPLQAVAAYADLLARTGSRFGAIEASLEKAS